MNSTIAISNMRSIGTYRGVDTSTESHWSQSSKGTCLLHEDRNYWNSARPKWWQEEGEQAQNIIFSLRKYLGSLAPKIMLLLLKWQSEVIGSWLSESLSSCRLPMLIVFVCSENGQHIYPTCSFFIEVKFTWYTIYHLKVYNLVVFRIFVRLCNPEL